MTTKNATGDRRGPKRLFSRKYQHSLEIEITYLGVTMHQQLGHLSEIHLNCPIYSERLYGFRMITAKADDHYWMKC